MLKHRLASGLSIGAVIIAGIILLPWQVLLALLLVVTALAHWEFIDLTLPVVPPRERIPVLVLGQLLVLALFGGCGACGIPPPVLVLVLALFILMGQQLFRRNGPLPERLAGFALSLIYVPLSLGFLLPLAWGHAAGTWPELPLHGRLLALYALWVVKISDVGAYAVGLSLGKHKLMPQISPAKTWEGLGGGVLCGLAGSLLASWLFAGLVDWPLHLRDALYLGMLLPLAGVLGDLCESVFKRAANVKDSGQWVPGMGGLLDVLDSIMFAAPVMCAYLWLVHA